MADVNLNGDINQTGDMFADLSATGELNGTMQTLDNLSGVLNKNGELLANLSFPIRIGGYIVYDAYINDDGYLMFVLYDDSEINVGYVKGAKGDTGDAFVYSDFTPEQLESLSAGSTYVHDQIASSAHWIINHTLNRHPAVTIVDTGGTTVIGEVIYINLNRVDVIFSAPFSGKAYLT